MPANLSGRPSAAASSASVSTDSISISTASSSGGSISSAAGSSSSSTGRISSAAGSISAAGGISSAAGSISSAAGSISSSTGSTSSEVGNTWGTSPSGGMAAVSIGSVGLGSAAGISWERSSSPRDRSSAGACGSFISGRPRRSGGGCRRRRSPRAGRRAYLARTIAVAGTCEIPSWDSMGRYVTDVGNVGLEDLDALHALELADRERAPRVVGGAGLGEEEDDDLVLLQSRRGPPDLGRDLVGRLGLTGSGLGVGLGGLGVASLGARRLGRSGAGLGGVAVFAGVGGRGDGLVLGCCRVASEDGDAARRGRGGR